MKDIKNFDSLLIVNYQISDSSNYIDFNQRLKMANCFFYLNFQNQLLKHFINSETKNEIQYNRVLYNSLFSYDYYQQEILFVKSNHNFFQNFDIFLSYNTGFNKQDIIAINKTGTIYLLYGFSKDNSILFINNEIGKANTYEKAYQICLFYLSIQQINNLKIAKGFTIITSENIHNIKLNVKKMIKKPAMIIYKNQIKVQIYSYESETDRIVEYSFLFVNDMIKNIDLKIINEGRKVIFY